MEIPNHYMKMLEDKRMVPTGIQIPVKMISEIIHKVEPEYPTVKDSWKKEIPDMLFVVLDFNKCKTQKLCTEKKKNLSFPMF